VIGIKQGSQAAEAIFPAETSEVLSSG